MAETLKVNNDSNYYKQSVFIEGDSLYRLIDPQGQSVPVHPHEFTNLLSDIHKAEQSLDPKMLGVAKITFDLANQTFKINDENFQTLPNAPFKAPPSKPTINTPPTQFEKEAQEAIGSNPRFKHLLFTEASTPNFREVKRANYDKIFITFQYKNKTSSLILDRNKGIAYFFDPLQSKNEQREILISKLKLHFRRHVRDMYRKTYRNESAHTQNSSETEQSVLRFYKNMTKDNFDVKAFFADAEASNSPQETKPRSIIPTYGDGNCGLHAFGEVTLVGNTPQYRWINGNPKVLLQEALQKPIEDEKAQLLFDEAQRDYCERHELDPASSDIKDRYLSSLTDSSEYTGFSEILLFAKFVAKKNVTLEGYKDSYNFGFEETISIRHIENKENPKLSHWERVY